ncbi:16S rRNA (uracil(1498)-N(3))-methyltransferase [Panacagrimonas sp.]|uniref:16S rRNA (uracil(1498)-N(3))-methyltransferase n=1 Tax=Panacagrimonas sp. TaxID=2480088 RepID=UPI003B52378A
MATRVFLDTPLSSGLQLELPEAAFRHLVLVLRMQAGEALIVFDGRGGEYDAKLDTVAKRSATLSIGDFHEVDRESPLQITLVQGISKGDRMDWTLQKAVEMGVAAIAPIITERCNVSLDREREAKKRDHWRGVLVSACEQSGRTRVPLLHPLQRYADWLASAPQGPRYLLDPIAAQALAQAPIPAAPISLVIGPEGGLSASEIAAGVQAGGVAVSLGPRVLRTETAGVVALAVLQARAGDLAGTVN